MRLAVLSDWHVDATATVGQVDLPALIGEALHARRADGLLIAGDVATGPDRVEAALSALRTAWDGPVYYVPGNHCIMAPNSWAAYHRLTALPESICGKVVDLPGGWALVGDLGWYDYGFGGPPFTPEQFATKRFSHITWLDGPYVHWNMPDRSVCDCFLGRIREQLEAGAGRRVILVTHMIPFAEFILHRSPGWNFCNAFMGTPRLGALAEQYRVAMMVFGHTHSFRTRVKRGEMELVVNPLGHVTEWKTSEKLPLPERARRELHDALTIVELPE
jgi:putative phosphoesterase